jgi:hypothetical protein
LLSDTTVANTKRAETGEREREIGRERESEAERERPEAEVDGDGDERRCTKEFK